MNYLKNGIILQQILSFNNQCKLNKMTTELCNLKFISIIRSSIVVYF